MQVVFFVLMIVLALGAAALFYTSQDKRGIRRSFVELMKDLPGTLKVRNPLRYPEAEVDCRGRKVKVYFQIHEYKRTSFLNLVYRTAINSDSTFLLLKKDFYSPIRDEAGLSRHVGEIIPDLENGYVVRAKDSERAKSLLKSGEVRGGLNMLKDFTSILIDSGMLLVTKPYDGTKDVTPRMVRQNIEHVEQLASVMEGTEVQGGSLTSKPVKKG
jgi:hypothetical protein